MTTWVRIFPDTTKEATHAPPRVVCATDFAPKLKKAWDQAAIDEGLGGTPGVKLAELLEEVPVGFLLDVGGIMWAHRHEYTFDLDGLPVKVPATDVESYLLACDKQPQETADGEEFWTLHSFMWRLVLTKPHIEMLRAELTKIAVEAAAIASAENKRFNEDMADAKHVLVPKRPVGPMGEG